MLHGNKQNGWARIALARSHRLQTDGTNTGSMHGAASKKGLVNPARPDAPETWIGSQLGVVASRCGWYACRHAHNATFKTLDRESEERKLHHC